MADPGTSVVRWRPGGPGEAYIYKNPSDLQLHFVSRYTGDVPITHSHGSVTSRIYSCPSAVSVGDWVAKDAGASSVVLANASNKATRAFGIVSQKITSKSCEVQRSGEFSGFAGLTPGAIYFLSRLDGLMTLPPINFSLSGLIQQIAVAKNSSIIEVNIGTTYEIG